MLPVLEVEAGISSHSFPAIFNCLIKKGHSLARRANDSFASAVEMGTGDDFMIAVATSDNGNARRLRAMGVAEEPVTGVENSLYVCRVN